MSCDFHELLYRDFKQHKTIIEIDPPKDTIDYVKNIANELASVEPKDYEAIKFSDVIYGMMPVVNKDNSIGYEYVPVLKNDSKKADVNEYINRFNNFDINNLPLVEVAKYLAKKVEKTYTLNAYGQYFYNEGKIILGTDFEPVFIHELAHAIDMISSNCILEPSFMELVAELSTVVLCKEYNIGFDASASLYYLDCYTNTKIEGAKLFERVAYIYEVVKFIKQDIKNGIYDLRQRGKLCW
jgi:hypothetical protein